MANDLLDFLLKNPRLQINKLYYISDKHSVQNQTKQPEKFSSSLSPCSSTCTCCLFVGVVFRKWAWSYISAHAHPSSEPPPRKSWICPCVDLHWNSNTIYNGKYLWYLILWTWPAFSSQTGTDCYSCCWLSSLLWIKRSNKQRFWAAIMVGKQVFGQSYGWNTLTAIYVISLL